VKSKTEGVGSLDKNGKISSFSATRYYGGATHYERGEFTTRKRKNGVNITGTSGVDFPIKDDLLDLIKTGKYKRMIASLEEALIMKLTDNLTEEYLNSRVFKAKDYADITKNRKYAEEKYKSAYVYQGQLFNDKGIIVDREFNGTSFSTPIRVAKLALHDSLKDILP